MHKLKFGGDQVTKKKWWIALIFAIASLLQITAYGASADIKFGTDAYEKNCGSVFFIGVYSEADENMGQSDIVLKYDTRYLEYEAGATSEPEKGTIHITQNISAKNGKCLLRFKAIAVGESEIKVDGANILTKNGDVNFTVGNLPATKMIIKSTKNNSIEGISINGTNVEGFLKDVYAYNMTIPYAESFEVNVSGAKNKSHNVTNISDTEKKIDIIAESEAGESFVYSVNLVMEKNEPEKPENESEKVTAENVTKENVGDASVETKPVEKSTLENESQTKEDELMSTIEKYRHSEMKKAIIMLMMGTGLISLIVFSIMKLREK